MSYSLRKCKWHVIHFCNNLLNVFVGRLQNLFSEEPVESEEGIASSSPTEEDVTGTFNECNSRRHILRERLKEKSPTLKSQLLSDMV